LRRRLGVPAARTRRAPQARRRRTPEAARGALVQIDGSPFAWFGARGPSCVLLGAIDDATSEILALHFRPPEDVHGYAPPFPPPSTRRTPTCRRSSRTSIGGSAKRRPRRTRCGDGRRAPSPSASAVATAAWSRATTP